MMALFVSAAPSVAQKISATGLSYAVSTIEQTVQGRPLDIARQVRSLTARFPTSENAAEMLYLVEKYAADRRQVSMFAEPDVGTEVLMLSRKANVFPLNDVNQDELLASAVTRALEFSHELQSGDLLFVEADSRRLHPVQVELVMKLCRQFGFERAEVTPHGMVAFRLRALREGQRDCLDPVR